MEDTTREEYVVQILLLVVLGGGLEDAKAALHDAEKALNVLARALSVLEETLSPALIGYFEGGMRVFHGPEGGGEWEGRRRLNCIIMFYFFIAGVPSERVAKTCGS